MAFLPAPLISASRGQNPDVFDDLFRARICSQSFDLNINVPLPTTAARAPPSSGTFLLGNDPKLNREVVLFVLPADEDHFDKHSFLPDLIKWSWDAKATAKDNPLEDLSAAKIPREMKEAWPWRIPDGAKTLLHAALGLSAGQVHELIGDSGLKPYELVAFLDPRKLFNNKGEQDKKWFQTFHERVLSRLAKSGSEEEEETDGKSEIKRIRTLMRQFHPISKRLMPRLSLPCRVLCAGRNSRSVQWANWMTRKAVYATDLDQVAASDLTKWYTMCRGSAPDTLRPNMSPLLKLLPAMEVAYVLVCDITTGSVQCIEQDSFTRPEAEVVASAVAPLARSRDKRLDVTLCIIKSQKKAVKEGEKQKRKQQTPPPSPPPPPPPPPPPVSARDAAFARAEQEAAAENEDDVLTDDNVPEITEKKQKKQDRTPKKKKKKRPRGMSFVADEADEADTDEDFDELVRDAEHSRGRKLSKAEKVALREEVREERRQMGLDEDDDGQNEYKKDDFCVSDDDDDDDGGVHNAEHRQRYESRQRQEDDDKQDKEIYAAFVAPHRKRRRVRQQQEDVPDFAPKQWFATARKVFGKVASSDKKAAATATAPPPHQLLRALVDAIRSKRETALLSGLSVARELVRSAPVFVVPQNMHADGLQLFVDALLRLSVTASLLHPALATLAVLSVIRKLLGRDQQREEIDLCLTCYGYMMLSDMISVNSFADFSADVKRGGVAITSIIESATSRQGDEGVWLMSVLLMACHLFYDPCHGSCDAHVDGGFLSWSTFDTLYDLHDKKKGTKNKKPDSMDPSHRGGTVFAMLHAVSLIPRQTEFLRAMWKAFESVPTPQIPDAWILPEAATEMAHQFLFQDCQDPFLHPKAMDIWLLNQASARRGVFTNHESRQALFTRVQSYLHSADLMGIPQHTASGATLSTVMRCVMAHLFDSKHNVKVAFAPTGTPRPLQAIEPWDVANVTHDQFQACYGMIRAWLDFSQGRVEEGEEEKQAGLFPELPSSAYASKIHKRHPVVHQQLVAWTKLEPHVPLLHGPLEIWPRWNRLECIVQDPRRPLVMTQQEMQDVVDLCVAETKIPREDVKRVIYSAGSDDLFRSLAASAKKRSSTVAMVEEEEDEEEEDDRQEEKESLSPVAAFLCKWFQTERLIESRFVSTLQPLESVDMKTRVTMLTRIMDSRVVRLPNPRIDPCTAIVADKKDDELDEPEEPEEPEEEQEPEPEPEPEEKEEQEKGPKAPEAKKARKETQASSPSLFGSVGCDQKQFCFFQRALHSEAEDKKASVRWSSVFLSKTEALELSVCWLEEIQRVRAAERTSAAIAAELDKDADMARWLVSWLKEEKEKEPSSSAFLLRTDLHQWLQELFGKVMVSSTAPTLLAPKVGEKGTISWHSPLLQRVGRVLYRLAHGRMSMPSVAVTWNDSLLGPDVNRRVLSKDVALSASVDESSGVVEVDAEIQDSPVKIRQVMGNKRGVNLSSFFHQDCADARDIALQYQQEERTPNLTEETLTRVVRDVYRVTVEAKCAGEWRDWMLALMLSAFEAAAVGHRAQTSFPVLMPLSHLLSDSAAPVARILCQHRITTVNHDRQKPGRLMTHPCVFPFHLVALCCEMSRQKLPADVQLHHIDPICYAEERLIQWSASSRAHAAESGHIIRGAQQLAERVVRLLQGATDTIQLDGGSSNDGATWVQEAKSWVYTQGDGSGNSDWGESIDILYARLMAWLLFAPMSCCIPVSGPNLSTWRLVPHAGSWILLRMLKVCRAVPAILRANAPNWGSTARPSRLADAKWTLLPSGTRRACAVIQAVMDQIRPSSIVVWTSRANEAQYWKQIPLRTGEHIGRLRVLEKKIYSCEWPGQTLVVHLSKKRAKTNLLEALQHVHADRIVVLTSIPDLSRPLDGLLHLTPHTSWPATHPLWSTLFKHKCSVTESRLSAVLLSHSPTTMVTVDSVSSSRTKRGLEADLTEFKDRHCQCVRTVDMERDVTELCKKLTRGQGRASQITKTICTAFLECYLETQEQKRNQDLHATFLKYATNHLSILTGLFSEGIVVLHPTTRKIWAQKLATKGINAEKLRKVMDCLDTSPKKAWKNIGGTEVFTAMFYEMCTWDKDFMIECATRLVTGTVCVSSESAKTILRTLQKTAQSLTADEILFQIQLRAGGGASATPHLVIHTDNGKGITESFCQCLPWVWIESKTQSADAHSSLIKTRPSGVLYPNTNLCQDMLSALDAFLQTPRPCVLLTDDEALVSQLTK